jgi:7-cyano-7-deazaguanine synthase
MRKAYRNGLVILSGGQDSTTCAVQAQLECERVCGVTFNYGQRHQLELEAAIAIASELKLDQYEVINLPKGILQSVSPLVSQNTVETYGSAEQLPSGIANTFIPCRNLLFLTIAANRAAQWDCEIIYTGVNQTDYSGYPDCRKPFIDRAMAAINQAIRGEDFGLDIAAPLLFYSKAQTVRLAYDILGAERFDEVFSQTHTCYNNVRGGCGKCAACLLRDKGFKEAGIDDPIWQYRIDSPSLVS